MWYLSKPIETWKEPDLLKLLDDKVPEGRCLEYKAALPGKSDSDRKEFLKDVSAFANADGRR